MIDLGIVKPGSTIRIPFGSFAGSTGAPSATTNYAAADIQIYKDGGTTQRASAAGITATADFDTLTGVNLVSIDLADNTTAGFYSAGSEYIVVVSDVTIDSQTMRFPVARFKIGHPSAILNTTIATLASQTSFTLTEGPAEDDALNGCVAYLHDVASAAQCGFAVVNDYTGSTKTVTLTAGTTYTAAATDNIMFMAPSNVRWLGTTAQTGRDIGTSVLLSSGTGTGQLDFTSGVVKANTTQVSGTAQTAGDLYPAITGIGTAGGAAINQDANTDNVTGGISGVTSGTTFLGTQTTNTYTATSNVNGVYHVITGTASGNTAMDIVYQFLTGGGTTPVEVVWTGYINSNNDTITLYAWNHVGGAWESLGTIAGQTGTTNVVVNRALYSRHAGTSAAERGKVYIRFACTGMTTPVLNTDQVKVTYAVTSRTVGYAQGSVWLDTSLSNTSTESYVDGTADNPVSTIAAALTICTNMGLRTIHVANGSSVTLPSALTNFTFEGDDWYLALNGQAVNECSFENATVSGTSSGTIENSFHQCKLGNCTLSPMIAFQTYLTGTVTAASTGDYFFLHCGDGVAGAASATFNFNSVANVNLHLQNYSGGIDWAGMAASSTVEWGGRGKGTIKNTCVGGSIIMRGAMDLVDQSGGAVTVTDTARWNEDQNITNVTGSVTGSVGSVTGNVGGSVASVAAGGITAASIATGAIDADALAADAVTEIWTGAPATIDANIIKVNGITVDGTGQDGDPWGPV